MGSQKPLIESEVKSFGGENIQAHSYSNYSVESEPSASLTPVHWRATEKESKANVRDWVKHWIQTGALHSVIALICS